jgi:hypothetical protein
MVKFDYNTKNECESNIQKRKNKKYEHLEMLFPIVGDKYQVSELLLERNNLITKKLKLVKVRNKSDDMIKYNNELLKLPFYKSIDNISVNNTFKYLFEKMFMGIYVKIVNNEVKLYVPFANMDFKNDWSNKIEFENNSNSVRNYQSAKLSNNKNSNLYNRTGYINYNIDEWTTNNCLIGNIINPKTKKSDVGDNVRYTIFKYILDLVCKKHKVSDIEFFINRRDNPMIRRNLTEPYFTIFDDINHPLVSHKYKKYAPILSTCGSSLFADFMIPCEDDINLASQKFFINPCNNTYIDSTNSIIWNKRISTAIFRGTASGCGVTIGSNQRLMLAHVSHAWESNDNYNENNTIDNTKYLDFGLTHWNSREKKPFKSKMTYIKPKNLKFQLSNKMDRTDQLNYKYHVYVDGHVAAYRMCWLLASGSVILKVGSLYDYKLWYFPLLKEWIHYVPVSANLTDLAERIKWCKQNDAKCKKISSNALKFYNKYLTMDGIVSYTSILLNMISGNQSNNILREIELWEHVLFKGLLVNDLDNHRHRHKCGIIISYRQNVEQNRERQLQKIIPYLENKLNNSWFKYNIYIIEQSDDDRKFNRGKLLNTGYDIARKDKCKYFIFHDVDLLSDDIVMKYYQVYPKNPIHIASVWKEKYTYENFIGGIMSMNSDDFKKINGFPNNYWGWGGEDDEMLKRIKAVKLIIDKPIEGEIHEIEHGWNESNGINKNNKNRLKKEHADTWSKNGLNDLKYKVISKNKISVKTSKFTVKL